MEEARAETRTGRKKKPGAGRDRKGTTGHEPACETAGPEPKTQATNQHTAETGAGTGRERDEKTPADNRGGDENLSCEGQALGLFFSPTARKGRRR